VSAGDAQPFHDGLAPRLAGTPLLVLLDIDGTLAPIAPRPELAVVPAETRETIAAFARRAGVHVALVTGRAAHDGRRMVAVDRTWVIGNHGAETVSPDGVTTVDAALEPHREALAGAARALPAELGSVAGLVIEDKTWSLSVHYRLAEPGEVPRVRTAVDAVAQRYGLVVTNGRMVFEVRAPVKVDKGTAVLALARRLGAAAPPASALMIGDDATDEDAFRVLRAHAPHAVTVRVREDPRTPTAAEFAVRDTAAVRETLAWLLRQRG